MVEDHADCASALSRLLERDGHQVLVARTVAEANRASAAAEFDVLLLDIILPDGSGLDLAPALRRSFPRAKMVAVTALGMPRDVQAIREAGFDAHVLKPYRLEALRLHVA